MGHACVFSRGSGRIAERRAERPESSLTAKAGEASPLMGQPGGDSIPTVGLRHKDRSSGICLDGRGGWPNGHLTVARHHTRPSLAVRCIESEDGHLADHPTFSIRKTACDELGYIFHTENALTRVIVDYSAPMRIDMRLLPGRAYSAEDTAQIRRRLATSSFGHFRRKQ